MKGESPKKPAGQWREATFGECAELIRESVSPSTMGDALYLGLEHIGEGKLALTGKGVAKDVTSTKSRFNRGDILFGKLRPYFRKVVRAPDDGLCSTDIWVVRAKPGVNQDYLFYCMASEDFVDFATSGSEGTRMPRAQWGHVSDYRLSLPRLPEQRAIAHVLGTLDDKIELNRQMNETLEEMARALFKSWFVDFEPVRAKMDGRWRRGESLPGLPAEHYDLFPNRLVSSEFGEVPEGWPIGEFNEIATQLRDNENPAASPDTVFSHFSIPAYDEGQTPKRELGESIKSTKSRVVQGTVLLSKLNPEIKRVWLADVASGERSICSTEFLVLQAKPPFQSSYVYCLALSPIFRQQIESIVTGTSKSHQRAPANAILSLEAIVPPARVIEAFETCAFGLLRSSMALRRGTRALTAQRNALLPRLMSGEVQMSKAKAIGGTVSSAT